MAYLLDANVFIQAKNLHYGLDFCPAFWDWLIQRNAARRVFSIEKVGDEIQAVADKLADWATDRGDDFFLKPDAHAAPGIEYGQRLGSASKVRAGRGQHLSSRSGLLPGGSRARIRTDCRNTRDSFYLDEEDQDS